MIPAFPVYLFDVDGTLVDSAADICGALRSVLANTACPDVDDAFLKRYIGYHLLDLFGDLFPGMPGSDVDKLITNYRTVYPSRQHQLTSVYPGVAETLARLPGRKSTATTKSTQTTRIILEQFGLVQHFDHVQGTDGFPCKPAPDVICRSLELFGASPEECLLVGDSAPDMEAGRRAGVKICGVRYGYGNLEKMSGFQPDYWIDEFSQLLPSTASHELHLADRDCHTGTAAC